MGEHRAEKARSSPGVDREVRIEARDDLLAGTEEVEQEQDRQDDRNKGTRHVTERGPGTWRRRPPEAVEPRPREGCHPDRVGRLLGLPKSGAAHSAATCRETPETGGIGNPLRRRSRCLDPSGLSAAVVPGHDPRLRFALVCGEGQPRREELVDEVMLLLRVCSLAGDSRGAPLSERLLGRAGGIRDVGGDCRGPRPCLE
jgi:hypothetical protein